MEPIDPVALFRFSVLGPLVSASHLSRGELKHTLEHLARQPYNVPGRGACYLSAKTLEAWYYAWRRGGIEALAPQPRADRGRSLISEAVQKALIEAKRDKPSRSINQVIALVEARGDVAHATLARASVHRLLKAQGLSTRAAGEPVTERRCFAAEHAGDIWYGDVMHGPRLVLGGGEHKTYLVSVMDDASRLIAYSAFFVDESALSIEVALKQALLRRGLPKRLVIDNGSAYRAQTLHQVCARLGIHLIHCRPYQPESKGKLERWHATVRAQFLDELDAERIDSLADLNDRLWIWLEQGYHQRPHAGLGGHTTPHERFVADLPRMRQLGALAPQLDALFYHRVGRQVRKDNTVSYQGRRFEVPLGLTGQRIRLVVDPHSEQVIAVENHDGEPWGPATALDVHANTHRRRRKSPSEPTPGGDRATSSTVETLYQRYLAQMSLNSDDDKE
jgi:transposase InsO family protein